MKVLYSSKLMILKRGRACFLFLLLPLLPSSQAEKQVHQDLRELVSPLSIELSKLVVKVEERRGKDCWDERKMGWKEQGKGRC